MLTLRALHAGNGAAVPGPGPKTDIVAAARDLLRRAVPAHLIDDRFAESWAAEVRAGHLVGAAAFAGAGDGMLVGFAGGILPTPGATAALDCLIDPLSDRTAVLQAVIGRAADDARAAGAARVEVWIKPVENGDDTVVEALGGHPYRALHQMRCPLPIPSELAGTPLPTRSFVPGPDDDALVRVNNRAFASHPVQGTLTVAELQRAMAEPWFRAAGVRMYEVDGTLAGFCWTKQHDYQPGGAAPLGEIYVICIDPDFHGRGLGRPMTAAGLDWLVDQGSSTAMLYVEADNTPALRTYEGLGFRVVRTDRAWTL